MYCDFAAGLRQLSSRELLPKERRLPGAPSTERPAHWRGALPDSVNILFQAIVAGTWHHRSPGETRVRVDATALVTFYDPALTSLAGARRGIPRLLHQLANISHADVETKLAEVAHVLKRAKASSGVDWRAVARVVVERYAPRLAQLNDTLGTAHAFANASAQAAAVRGQLLTMLEPYMSEQDVPHIYSAGDVSWIGSAVARCASVFVGHVLDEVLTPQERLLRNAVQGTAGEICRRLGLMWADAYDIEVADLGVAARALEEWQMHTTQLMEWLDWTVWQTCRPACAPSVSFLLISSRYVLSPDNLQEFCYLATWPFMVEGDRWEDKTPRCIRNDKDVLQVPRIG
jgi:hypothetical protein